QGPPLSWIRRIPRAFWSFTMRRCCRGSFLADLFSFISKSPKSRNRKGQRRQIKRFPARLVLEQLDGRIAPASHTWSGAVGLNWSNAENWSAGGAPVANETNVQLVFPAGATSLAGLSNDVSNLSITSIAFNASGYSITAGNSVTFASGT